MNTFILRSFLLASLYLLICSNLVQAQPTARESEIRVALETYVQQKVSGLGYDARIKRVTIPKAKLPVDGLLEYEVIAPQQWEGWGNANVAVIVRQDDRVVSNITVRIEIEALADMVVTAKHINQGNIISASDVALRKQDIAISQGKFLRQIEDVVGRKARITFRPNSVIKQEQLEKIALIRPGQIVTVIVETATMRVTVTGKAKNGGSVGDTITVQNLSSLKEFPARIIDADTVQVSFR